MRGISAPNGTTRARLPNLAEKNGVTESHPLTCGTIDDWRGNAVTQCRRCLAIVMGPLTVISLSNCTVRHNRLIELWHNSAKFKGCWVPGNGLSFGQGWHGSRGYLGLFGVVGKVIGTGRQGTVG
jgi:hypothetical protein